MPELLLILHPWRCLPGLFFQQTPQSDSAGYSWAEGVRHRRRVEDFIMRRVRVEMKTHALQDMVSSSVAGG